MKQGNYMKSVIALLVFAFCSSSFAWTSTAPQTRDYVFKYSLSGKMLEVRKPAASYEDAFKQAAQQCFNFYKEGKKVSEDRGLDIIDVCANPRS
jgi:type IV secretory pathway TrbF-like protein